MRKLLLVICIALSAFVTAAPVYNANPPYVLGPGSAAVVWSAETPTPGTGGNAASQQVSLAHQPGGGSPFSVDGRFSGAPGAFEVDVQVASNDADADYQTVSNGAITTVDATNFTFHLDAGLAATRFVRLLMRTRTNGVSITARVSQ